MAGTLQRALLIVALGGALGLLANSVSPHGIPLISPPKKPLQAEGIATLEQAREYWNSGSAVFLDARAPADYAAGHIANAFNLPADAFEEHFPRIAPMVNTAMPIVVYCDGEACELSHRLADKLHQLGYTTVRVLVNGWTVWHGAQLPTQKGPQP